MITLAWGAKKTARFSFRSSKSLESALNWYASTRGMQTLNAAFESITLAFLQKELEKEGLVLLHIELKIQKAFISELVETASDFHNFKERVKKYTDKIEQLDKEYLYERYIVYVTIPDYPKKKAENLKEVAALVSSIPPYLQLPRNLYCLYKIFSIDLLALKSDIYESSLTLNSFAVPNFLSAANQLKYELDEYLICSLKKVPLSITFADGSDEKTLLPLHILDLLLQSIYPC